MRAMKEVWRVLRPGAKYFLLTSCPVTPSDAAQAKCEVLAGEEYIDVYRVGGHDHDAHHIKLLFELDWKILDYETIRLENLEGPARSKGRKGAVYNMLYIIQKEGLA